VLLAAAAAPSQTRGPPLRAAGRRDARLRWTARGGRRVGGRGDGHTELGRHGAGRLDAPPPTRTAAGAASSMNFTSVAVAGRFRPRMKAEAEDEAGTSRGRSACPQDGQRSPCPWAPQRRRRYACPRSGSIPTSSPSWARPRTSAWRCPRNATTVGHYSGGASAGEQGLAIYSSHVVYRGAEGGFAHLAEVAPGDQVLVQRADKVTVVYRVDPVDQVEKDTFPTQAIYGPPAGPQLRLITCGGTFDDDAHSYTDNVVEVGRLDARRSSLRPRSAFGTQGRRCGAARRCSAALAGEGRADQASGPEDSATPPQAAPPTRLASRP
jgi:Sortase domain